MFNQSFPGAPSVEKFQLVAALLLILCMGSGCSGEEKREQDQQIALRDASWQQIEQQARGQTVTMMMWKGDPNINDYMQNWVKPRLKERQGVNLEIAGGQGNTIVSILMKELEAGSRSSQLDLMWINGETFYQLRQIDALYGPFVDKLPHAGLLDMDDPFVKYDFQQPINGYEVPWGTVQFTMIYDTAKVTDPPRTLQELEQFVRRHPGKFTIPTDFTGMTLLKSLMISMAGAEKLQGDFDEEIYKTYSNRLWEYLNRLKPYFWRSGRTFPADVSQLHRLYSNGQVWITMSNNHAEADNKVAERLFPESSRAYVLESGTIRNSHYLGIPVHSEHKAAAMVVANFLISPEAQWQKSKPSVWGDGTVLERSELSAEWRKQFREVSDLDHAPAVDTLRKHALRELAPEYMMRLYEDFRQHVVQ